MVINVIPDVQSDLDFFQKARMSFKIPLRPLWRDLKEPPPSVHIEPGNFTHSFLNVNTRLQMKMLSFDILWI